MYRFAITIVLLLGTLQVSAQESEPKKQSFILKGLYWVKTLIDSSAVRGVDRTYIEQPKRSWAVEVRTDASESTLKMHTDYNLENDISTKMSSKTSNGFTTSLGAWVGYRGYGLGWSKELTGGDGTTFSIGAAGGSFGINLRIHTYRSNTPEFTSVSICVSTLTVVTHRSLFIISTTMASNIVNVFVKNSTTPSRCVPFSSMATISLIVSISLTQQPTTSP